jgi:AraC family transcriptional regulator
MSIVFEQPRFEDGRPMLIAGLAERHSGTDAGIPAQWRRLATRLGSIPGRIGRVTYGVVFDSLKGTLSFGYLAGVEVSRTANLPKGFGHLEIPAQRYAVFTHHGHVSMLPHTMHAIWCEWLPAAGAEPLCDGADFLERYDERFDPHTGTGGIEIWLPINPRPQESER